MVHVKKHDHYSLDRAAINLLEINEYLPSSPTKPNCKTEW